MNRNRPGQSQAPQSSFRQSFFTGLAIGGAAWALAGGAGAAEPIPVLELVPPAEIATGEVQIIALAANEDIREVGFWVDGRFAGRDKIPPFELNVDLGDQLTEHSVRAVAIDKRKVVVGDSEIKLNPQIAEFAAEVERSEPDGYHLLARATPRAPPIGSFALYDGEVLLAHWPQDSLDVRFEEDAFGDAPFLRLVAEFTDGRTRERYLVLAEDGFAEAVEVHEIQMHLTLTDAKGAPVLNADSLGCTYQLPGFASQEVSFLRPHPAPLTLGLILDGSGSMREQRQTVQRSAEEIASSLLREGDRLLLFDVADRPRLLNPEGTTESVLEALEEIVDDGYSALYDSIYFAIAQLADQPNPKGLILVSDGANLRSSLERDRVLEASLDYGVPVFLLANRTLFSYSLGSERAQAQLAARQMRTLVEITGGRTISASTARQQVAAVASIADQLRNPYVAPLSRATAWSPNVLRQVAVECDDPELVPRFFFARNEPTAPATPPG